MRELQDAGAPPEVIEAHRVKPFELWDVNEPVFRLFDALGTQWRHAGMSAVRVGLDYGAIKPTAEGVEVAFTPEIFDGLRAMEHAALQVWSEQRKREEAARA